MSIKNKRMLLFRHIAYILMMLDYVDKWLIF